MGHWGIEEMSNFHGHIIGGGFAYLLVLMLIGGIHVYWTKAFAWGACALAGALFPDLDTKSRGQRYFYWLMLVVFIYLVILQRLDLVAIVAILCIVPLLTRHRGLFHQTWFILLCSVVSWVMVYILFPTYSHAFAYNVLFFISGALSHIWLDYYFVPAMRTLGIYKKRSSGRR